MELELEALRAILKPAWTVWMMLLFAGIAIYAFWPGNRRRFDALGRIPLEDDNRTARATRPEE
ncbi:MAG: cbb3-type cytochrome c oxidase subunit 3 [Alphaproteobacteria bacterium]|nr:cbb3-type cytochrome c oxidase subunit 3 [Alphaproteobacteria bacterium]